jgi:flagellar basal body L-ring protein FlgH
MKWFFFITALLFSGGLLSADSLWDGQFQGYIAGSSAFRAGDIVTIVIDSSLSLNFASAGKDSKAITLDFGGGEYGGLFSFLPRAKTGDDRSVTGKENYSLQTEIAARVTDIDPTGKLVIAGSRSIQLEGKQETVTLSGRIDPKTVDASRKFNFSRIENARLSFSGFLKPQTDLLSAKDIQTIVNELKTGPNGETTKQTTTQLTDQKKKELLLLYLNRLIDVIFR